MVALLVNQTSCIGQYRGESVLCCCYSLWPWSCICCLKVCSWS